MRLCVCVCVRDFYFFFVCGAKVFTRPLSFCYLCVTRLFSKPPVGVDPTQSQIKTPDAGIRSRRPMYTHKRKSTLPSCITLKRQRKDFVSVLAQQISCSHTPKPSLVLAGSQGSSVGDDIRLP